LSSTEVVTKKSIGDGGADERARDAAQQAAGNHDAHAWSATTTQGAFHNPGLAHLGARGHPREILRFGGARTLGFGDRGAHLGEYLLALLGGEFRERL